MNSVRSPGVLVSACLLGLNCRYCGTGSYKEQVVALTQRYRVIPICPEQMGGLPTPRTPVELASGRAIDSKGVDYTEHFERGATEVVQLAKLLDCTYAVLMSRSPSCGCGQIYDGTFTGRLINGNGITTDRLQVAGIKVIDESNLCALLN